MTLEPKEQVISSASNRNGKIELLRFLFCICILLYHIRSDLKVDWDSGLFSLSRRGSMGVEFFFLVSGFLMARSIRREPADQQTDLGTSTWHFLAHKIKGVLPYQLTFSFVMAVIFLFQSNGIAKIIRAFPSVFFLQCTGITGSSSYLGVDWYLSSMLLAMAIIYPLCKKYYSVFSRIIAPLAGITILGSLTGMTGNIGTVYEWVGFTYKCNFRAFAEICLGIFCYEICAFLLTKEISRKKKTALSILEAGCYLAVFRYCFSNYGTQYQAYIVLLLCIAIPISFSRQSALGESRIFSNRICCLLGSLSLPIYLVQKPIRFVIEHFFSFLPVCALIALILAASIAAGTVSYFLWGWVRSSLSELQRKRRVYT